MKNHHDCDLLVSLMAERGLHTDSEYTVERMQEAMKVLPLQEMLRQLMFATVANVALVNALEENHMLPEGFIDEWVQNMALDARAEA